MTTDPQSLNEFGLATSALATACLNAAQAIETEKLDVRSAARRLAAEARRLAEPVELPAAFYRTLREISDGPACPEALRLVLLCESVRFAKQAAAVLEKTNAGTPAGQCDGLSI